MTIVMTPQTCGCTCDDHGKLIERANGCTIDHVPADADTKAEPLIVETNLQHVIDRCEMAAKTMRAKNPNRLLLLNCCNAFRQLANTINLIGQENDMLREEIVRLKAELETQAGETKRIVLT